MEKQTITYIILTLLLVLPLAGSLFYIGRLSILQLIALKKQSRPKPVVRAVCIFAFLGLVLIIGLFMIFIILWFFWFRTLYLPLFVKICGLILVPPYLGVIVAIYQLSRGVEFGLGTSKIGLLFKK